MFVLVDFVFNTRVRRSANPVERLGCHAELLAVGGAARHDGAGQRPCIRGFRLAHEAQVQTCVSSGLRRRRTLHGQCRMIWTFSFLGSAKTRVQELSNGPGIATGKFASGGCDACRSAQRLRPGRGGNW